MSKIGARVISWAKWLFVSLCSFLVIFALTYFQGYEIDHINEKILELEEKHKEKAEQNLEEETSV